MRRGRLEILYDALEFLAAKGRLRKTRLMQFVGLNPRSFQRLLDFMMAMGLIANDEGYLVLTERGRDLYMLLRALAREGVLGGEPAAVGDREGGMEGAGWAMKRLGGVLGRSPDGKGYVFIARPGAEALVIGIAGIEAIRRGGLLVETARGRLYIARQEAAAVQCGGCWSHQS